MKRERRSLKGEEKVNQDKQRGSQEDEVANTEAVNKRRRNTWKNKGQDDDGEETMRMMTGFLIWDMGDQMRWSEKWCTVWTQEMNKRLKLKEETTMEAACGIHSVKFHYGIKKLSNHFHSIAHLMDCISTSPQAPVSGTKIQMKKNQPLILTETPVDPPE